MRAATRPAAARVRLATAPDLGARVPGVTPRVALAVVGTLLCLMCLPAGWWLAGGLSLTAIAAVSPQRLLAWVLLLYLAGSLLPAKPSGVTWRFLVLLAGLHLVHLLAAQTLEAPWRGWMQLAVFRRPLLRFVAIQVPAQALAVVLLLLLTPAPSHRASAALPAFAVVGGAALVVLAVLLAVPLWRERQR